MIDPRELIGKHIKDDQILEIISKHDLKVWYDIDCDHENIPDAYWIHDLAHGFTLKCDETQHVYCCFVYLRPLEDHEPFPWPITGIEIKDGRIPTLGQPTKTGSYNGATWARYDGPRLAVNLTCDSAGPKTMTFMDVSRAP